MAIFNSYVSLPEVNPIASGVIMAVGHPPFSSMMFQTRSLNLYRDWKKLPRLITLAYIK